MIWNRESIYFYSKLLEWYEEFKYNSENLKASKAYDNYQEKIIPLQFCFEQSIRKSIIDDSHYFNLEWNIECNISDIDNYKIPLSLY
jgi:hypothetical protein